MSVALAGRSPTTFEIKSASLPLLALRLKSPDLQVLEDELRAQYGDKPDFFDHDLLVLDLSTLQAEASEEASPAELDFPAIVALLTAHRLRPLAVRGGNDEQMAAAVAAGLLAANDVRVQTAARPPEPPPTTATAAQPEPSALEAPPPGALVIDRPLRSGQQVYARGRDLVVMAMVNPGAEVIADGHIHVYAPLRGRAIAGARGWPDARIFAREMKPELVSISGVYRTSDEALPGEVWGHAATVRLQSSEEAGDKLIFEQVNA
ncbi:septum site-determining protein MinC [Ottowia sp. GY511]|uniref:Probable septum site-determining protein MinC n=1 Tax=Ottowia flava TaxID=2675430 RepID=A0ABW4KYK7_9BURK|nr:septum site-determining protein MinC [Ottowia sp. GY511]TXK28553.1 septum site-determining protein MinC [Ottowia sp. GY511]